VTNKLREAPVRDVCSVRKVIVRLREKKSRLVWIWENLQFPFYPALSGNPVIFVMVSWMYNNAKDVKTEIDNTLRVSLAFAPLR